MTKYKANQLRRNRFIFPYKKLSDIPKFQSYKLRVSLEQQRANFFKISKKQYSTSRDLDTLETSSTDSGDPSRVDPSNGYSLDRTQDVSLYCTTPEQAREYFSTKEQSIRNTYRQDSNSGAIEGVDARELDNWMNNRDSLLVELVGQKTDVYLDNDFSEDSASSSGESTNENNSPNMPQDSSDVTQTEFDSSDYYDDV